MTVPDNFPFAPRLSNDTGPVVVERAHWLNTIVGLLDSAFSLTEEEQFYAVEIVRNLLTLLGIPGRSQPNELSAPLALEVTSSYYTLQLYSRYDSGVVRPVTAATGNTTVVPAEMWRSALLRMLTTSHPDLAPDERMLAATAFDDLLAGLGVPHRGAAHLPEDVVREVLAEQRG